LLTPTLNRAARYRVNPVLADHSPQAAIASRGRVEQLPIMSFGGFLGIGDSYHPLPWDQLTYDTNMGGYVVNLDRARLEGAPSYATSDTTAWDDPEYGRRVNEYYGRTI
jgi:hypothetical protein